MQGFRSVSPSQWLLLLWFLVVLTCCAQLNWGFLHKFLKFILLQAVNFQDMWGCCLRSNLHNFWPVFTEMISCIVLSSEAPIRCRCDCLLFLPEVSVSISCFNLSFQTMLDFYCPVFGFPDFFHCWANTLLLAPNDVLVSWVSRYKVQTK